MNEKEIMHLIDYTRLTDEPHDDNNIIQFCHQAITYQQQGLGVASICIYPQYVSLAKKHLTHTQIRITTVANFPSGRQSIEAVEQSIQLSLAAGADEIDVVLPYHLLKTRDVLQVENVLKHVRTLTKGHILKVIIESSELDVDEIHIATRLVAKVGADFVKTSTGKVKSGGATLEAVKAICTALTVNNPYEKIGVKVSGGVTSPEKASAFIKVIGDTMGEEWISPQHVRIGASQLADKLVE
ncbi:MAG: deoxyribose-phosphate aldolase [Gammaproteobacteria bacterium]|nr:deoxyribose-phosphate aldolase [Gammaproteobacteria bacterium]